MKMHLLLLSNFYEIITSFVFSFRQIVSDKKIEKQNVIWSVFQILMSMLKLYFVEQKNKF